MQNLGRHAIVIVLCCWLGTVGRAGMALALTLMQTDIIVGAMTAWRVGGAAPGEHVYVLVGDSGIGEGPCPLWLGGMCLHVVAPDRLIGPSVANAQGVATLKRMIPTAPTGTTAITQAFVRRGATGQYSVKSPAKATVIGNHTPVPRAGGPYDVRVTTPVILDGTFTVDDDKDTLAYLWKLTEAPNDSALMLGTGSLGNATQAIATMTPDVIGEYRVTLTANDSKGGVAVATTTVSASDPDLIAPGTCPCQ